MEARRRCAVVVCPESAICRRSAAACLRPWKPRTPFAPAEFRSAMLRRGGNSATEISA